MNKNNLIVINYPNGKIESLSESEFNKKYNKLTSVKKKDKGFGFCTCGLPLQKVSKNSDVLCCYAEAFCENKTGIIKKS